MFIASFTEIVQGMATLLGEDTDLSGPNGAWSRNLVGLMANGSRGLTQERDLGLPLLLRSYERCSFVKASGHLLNRNRLIHI